MPFGPIIGLLGLNPVVDDICYYCCRLSILLDYDSSKIWIWLACSYVKSRDICDSYLILETISPSGSYSFDLMPEDCNESSLADSLILIGEVSSMFERL